MINGKKEVFFRIFLTIKGFTLVEMIFVAALFVLILGGGLQVLHFFTTKKATNISDRLALQIEARRALVNLYSEIQEGIELVKPDPGSTLPYLVLRDYVNNLHVIFLKKDYAATEQHKQELFRLYSLVYDVKEQKCSPMREIIRNVKSLNFTAHGFGSVVVSGIIQQGESSFPFLNMIRVKNTSAED